MVGGKRVWKDENFLEPVVGFQCTSLSNAQSLDGYIVSIT